MERSKLLIVEDEEGIQQQLKWSFAGEYQVFLASDWESARQVLERERPPMVTLDLGLPPLPHSPGEGLQLLSEVMRMDPWPG